MAHDRRSILKIMAGLPALAAGVVNAPPRAHIAGACFMASGVAGDLVPAKLGETLGETIVAQRGRVVVPLEVAADLAPNALSTTYVLHGGQPYAEIELAELNYVRDQHAQGNEFVLRQVDDDIALIEDDDGDTSTA